MVGDVLHLLVIPCVSQLLFTMLPCDLDSRSRALAKTCQLVSGKMDLPPSPAKAVFGRAQFFPCAPLPYLRRVCQYWQLLHLDFIPLDRRHRLIVRVYEAHLELIGLLIYRDLSPSPPPRWLVDPFLIFTRMICRGMDRNKGMLRDLPGCWICRGAGFGGPSLS